MAASLDLRQLRYFVAIVDHRSLSAAARALHVAQPALSHHLRNLEATLGHRLLHREARGVRPTLEGELLFRHAVGVLRQVDGLKAVLARAPAALAGPVSIGLPKTAARLLALPLFEAVRHRHPHIALEIADGHSLELGRAVVEGRIDAALIMPPAPMRGSVELPFLTEELVVVAPPRADWLPPARALSPSDLSRMPMLMSNRRERLHALLATLIAEAGVVLDVRGHIDELGSLLGAVKAGHGATVLPWCAVGQEVAGGELVVRRIRGPRLQRQLLLCRAQSLALSAAAVAACELMHACCRKLIDDGYWRGTRLTRRTLALEEA